MWCVCGPQQRSTVLWLPAGLWYWARWGNDSGRKFLINYVNDLNPLISFFLAYGYRKIWNITEISHSMETRKINRTCRCQVGSNNWEPSGLGHSHIRYHFHSTHWVSKAGPRLSDRAFEKKRDERASYLCSAAIIFSLAILWNIYVFCNFTHNSC